jgi:hypothetical protein
LQSQRAEEETNEINSDQRCESLPASSKSGIDDIVPPEVENKACGKREPDEGRVITPAFTRSPPKIVPRACQRFSRLSLQEAGQGPRDTTTA